jgi:hypothetical protein
MHTGSVYTMHKYQGAGAVSAPCANDSRNNFTKPLSLSKTLVDVRLVQASVVKDGALAEEHNAAPAVNARCPARGPKLLFSRAGRQRARFRIAVSPFFDFFFPVTPGARKTQKQSRVVRVELVPRAAPQMS